MMSTPPQQLRTSSCRRHLRQRGLTLVEVLATLVLVAIVLPVTMKGVTLSMQSAARARHMTEAAQLAESKINEMLVLRDTMYLSGSGDFGQDWPEYRWTSTAAAANYGVYEVTVTVSWLERGSERSVSMSTLVYPAVQGLQ
jgi:prepilin-type N-terminal cleavage/methylation domain-containing protein